MSENKKNVGCKSVFWRIFVKLCLRIKKRWDANQFDRLAAGSLAGHLIECGAQVCMKTYCMLYIPENIDIKTTKIHENKHLLFLVYWRQPQWLGNNTRIWFSRISCCWGKENHIGFLLLRWNKSYQHWQLKFVSKSHLL